MLAELDARAGCLERRLSPPDFRLNGDVRPEPADRINGRPALGGLVPKGGTQTGYLLCRVTPDRAFPTLYVRGRTGSTDEKAVDIADPATRPTATASSTQVVPPTTTPRPIAHIGVTGRFTSLARVGGVITFTFALTSLSDMPIAKVEIFSGSGPWDKVTVISVTGTGSYDRGLFGSTFVANAAIPPGKTGTVEITISPNEPGNFDFGFEFPRLTDPDGWSVDSDGHSLQASVRVTR